MSLEEGERLRDLGMNRALMGADAFYKEAFSICLDMTIKKRHKFSSDAVQARLERYFPGAKTKSRNVVGALMGAASRSGRIRAVGIKQSNRTKRHAGVIQIWKPSDG